MRVIVYSAKPYDREFLEQANKEAGHHLSFVDARLSTETVGLARDHDVICAFVNDDMGEAVVEELEKLGVRLIALRSAGFNHVALKETAKRGIAVGRVPAYSPHAVAEHAVALMLTLNRKTHRAYNRVREGNFALDGLLGFDLFGKTVGIVGTGLIGSVLARIMTGFGCRVIAHDPYPNPDCLALGVAYVSLDQILAESDILTLQCPLTPETRHLVNDRTIAAMKPGVMIVNASRGEVVDTRAVIRGLKSGHIGSLALDVYEEEADLFFEDKSASAIPDDVFARLLTFPNVIVTGHQGFFTAEALTAIAETTIANLTAFETTGQPVHRVELPKG